LVCCSRDCRPVLGAQQFDERGDADRSAPPCDSENVNPSLQIDAFNFSHTEIVPVVVSFHRGHWCPYCRIIADALSGIAPEVRAVGAEIVLITPEVQKFSSKLKSDARASFSVLTDLDSGYALELQLAIKIEDEKRLAMTRAGWDISAFQDDENWTLPIPATFVVGSDRSVKARFVDPDYRKRMDVDDILRALRT
jgi:peroxiredoxin